MLRRRGLPWWGATIPALPVLFDVFELQIEHMVAADVLFYGLLTAVLVLLTWWDRPPLAVAVLAGLAARRDLFRTFLVLSGLAQAIYVWAFVHWYWTG